MHRCERCPEVFGSCEALVRAIARADAARTIQRVKRLVLLLALVGLVVATAAAAAPTTTAKQLTTRWKAATGVKLVVNKQMSYAGHYVAYDLGTQSGSGKARFGTFTVLLVTDPDVETQVTSLLSDTHTGTLGTPGAGNIYWESGSTVHGDTFWQAKRRYGQNVVVWWTTTSGQKKTDATWKRLHAALTKATK